MFSNKNLFSDQISNINSLIVNPNEFINNLKNVKLENQKLVNDYKNLIDTSLKNINKQIYLEVVDSIKSYADIDKIQNDLKTHKYKNQYNIKFKDYSKNVSKELLNNSFDDDLFDDLYMSENEQEYFKTMKKIENNLNVRNNFIIDNINNISSKYLIDYKSKVLNYIKTDLLPKLYKFHLSYLQQKQKGITEDIKVKINNEIEETINTKQQEFLNHYVKKYLNV